MVVRAVERAARVGSAQPLEGLLVPDVHPQGHLRLAAVAPEVALADQEAQKEADGEIVLVDGSFGVDSPARCGARIGWTTEGNDTSGCCFTVKLCAKQCSEAEFEAREGFPQVGAPRWRLPTRENPSRAASCLGKLGITPCPDDGRGDPAIISR